MGALTLGTMGLAVVAALVWNYNLHSTVVQVASWMTAGLLFAGIGIFGAKIGLLLIHHPSLS